MILWRLYLLGLLLGLSCKGISSVPDTLEKALFEHYVLGDGKAARADYESFISGAGSSENMILEKVQGSYQKLLQKQMFDSSPAYGDSLIMRLCGNPDTLNPLTTMNPASQDVFILIFELLLPWEAGSGTTKGLTESWEVSADGMECILHLRKNVKWHDGVEFTADDVGFTYEFIMNPESVNLYRPLFNLSLKTLEIIDPYTVRAKFVSNSPRNLASLSFYILPKHILENKTVKSDDFFQHPIGTGPFSFSRWESDEQIVLDAFKEYYRGRPFLDHLVLKIVPDDSAAFLMMLRDELDLKRLTPDQYLKQANSDEFRSHFNVHAFPTNCRYYALWYDLTSAFLKDRKIRQALAEAIDLQEIINQVFHGFGRTITGTFIFADWAYDKSIRPYPYDPGSAAKILAEAGWKDGNGDGILERDGLQFSLELVTILGDPINRFIAEMVSEYWKAVGIKTRVSIQGREKESPVIVGSCLLDEDQYLWHSSQIPTKENGFSGCNVVSYANQEVDRLLDLKRVTSDRESLAAIYHKLQAIMYEDQPVMFICAPDDLWAVNKRFRGVTRKQDGVEIDYSLIYVPQEFQKYAIH
ncbi:MAG: ABC transporter substrate-binding protein [Candidatus Wallbacteria bacterium]|nr:ABC transporter substrate-binding protein [Candidatus Wallbacteria bacterium]